MKNKKTTENNIVKRRISKEIDLIMKKINDISKNIEGNIKC